MRVLVFGTYDTSMHPRIAIIAEGLAANGLDVSECNAPLGLSTADRVSMLAQPWRVPMLLGRLASRWSTLAARSLRMPAPDVVVVGYLGHFDVVLARALFGLRGTLRRRKIPIVLDHLVGASDTGRDRRLDGGPRQALLRMIDATALGSADIIVVDTDEHLASLPGQHRDRGVVVHVGAPAAWHEAARDDEARGAGETSPAEGPLRVVFYGLYTPLQGTPVIGAALGKVAAAPDAPAIEVTMIGRGQDEAEAKSAAASNAVAPRGDDPPYPPKPARSKGEGIGPAVTWLDWVPAAELPALVARHDVCLGIFGTGEKARRVVPNKVFQGAAAGCAIITSDTAPQRRVLGDAAVLVPPGDPGALAAALLDLARDRDRLRELRAAARELARKHFAPATVVAPLIEKISR